MNFAQKHQVKCVLLTGASGFLGSHCLPILLEQGFEVHAVSRNKILTAQSGVFWHSLDLHDTSAVKALLTQIQPDALLHLAWYTEPGLYWQSLKNFDWVENSLRLLQIFHEVGGKRAVVSGTCAEYDLQHGFCQELLTPRNPNSVYGSTKHGLRILAEAFAQSTQMSLAWGHLFYLFGPGEHPARLVPSLFRAICEKEALLCTHGNQIRDFLYIKDAANALVSLLESDLVGPINICSGIPLILKDFIQTLVSMTDSKPKIEWGAIPVPKTDFPFVVGNHFRLTHELGWRPQFSLEKALAETWQNVLGNHPRECP